MPDGFFPIQRLSKGPPDANTTDQLRKPHVLLVVDGFARTLGGGERVVLRMAALLPRYGYRASILTFAYDPASEFQLADAPCPVYLIPLRKTYDLLAWRAAWALGKFLRQQRIQIVQTFFESSDLWAGSFARLLSPARVIWSRRDMGILRGRMHDRAYRLLRRLPSAVIAVSEQVRRHAIEVDGISPNRVFTIHNGLELTPVSPAPDRPQLNRDHVRVTTVGNIRQVKGHDLLVRAAAVVVKAFPNTFFTVAGEVLDPAFHAQLEALVRELGLDERFEFLGRITDLPSHLAEADIFVLPSRSEGFSNALIEAMAAGLPAIATDVGGNAEALQDGITGLLIPSEDVSELSDALLKLIASPEIARAMGRRGEQAAHDHFSADAMMHKTTAVYAAALGSR